MHAIVLIRSLLVESRRETSAIEGMSCFVEVGLKMAITPPSLILLECSLHILRMPCCCIDWSINKLMYAP